MRALLAVLIVCVGSPALAGCKWEVRGKLQVVDEIFVGHKKKATRALSHADVVVYASITKSGAGWVPFKEGRTDSKGNFKVRRTAPVPCSQKHRFKVNVRLKSREAALTFGPGDPYWFTAYKNTKRRWPAKKADLGTIKLEGGSKSNKRNNLRKATRAAATFIAARKMHGWLKSKGLSPKKIKIAYPDNVATYADPVCQCARLKKGWFDNASNKSGKHKYIYTETLHEAWHIWWNQHLFFPNVLRGKKSNTHEFVESPALALYEAFAEYAANILMKQAFGLAYRIDMRPESRSKIKAAFKSNKASLTKWDSAERVALNYLKLLTTKSWPGGCTAPKQFYTPVALLKKFKGWKRHLSGKKGIREFIDYLAKTDRGFKPHKTQLLRMGDPRNTKKCGK